MTAVGGDPTETELSEVLALMRAARAKERGYADFFQWPNRDLEELGVAQELLQALDRQGHHFLFDLKTRGRGFDPPDCEGMNSQGDRVAIEVSELVDEAAVRAVARARRDNPQSCLPTDLTWVEWDIDKFTENVDRRLRAKDRRFNDLKDGPYTGGYVVVLYTDEPALTKGVVEQFVSRAVFTATTHLSRAFLLLSYDPEIKGYPVFELIHPSSNRR